MGAWGWNGLVGLSLLLCLATVVAAIRSHYVSDAFHQEAWSDAEQQYTSRLVVCNDGRLSIHLWVQQAPAEFQAISDTAWAYRRQPAEHVEQEGSYWGYFHQSQLPGWGGVLRQRVLALELWPLASVLAVLPAVAVFSLLRARKRAVRGDLGKI
jgi:hypothetical protein